MHTNAASPCPCCNEPRLRPFMTCRGFPLLRCSSCDAWCLADAGDPSDVHARYAEGYFQRGSSDSSRVSGYFDYEAERRLHVLNFQQHLKLVQRFSSGPRLLDVGCATGHFLEVARKAGFQGTGLDLSPEALEAVRKAGFETHAGPLETVPGEGIYDVITLWETLEHLPDPAPALRRAHALLKPGGLLAVATGDTQQRVSRLLGRRWWYLTPPDHCVYYNPTALTRLLERTGFQVKTLEHIPFHWVSSQNGVMKALRSLGLNQTEVLKWAARVPSLPIMVWHNTTLAAVAARGEG